MMLQERNHITGTACFKYFNQGFGVETLAQKKVDEIIGYEVLPPVQYMIIVIPGTRTAATFVPVGIEVRPLDIRTI